MQPKPRWLKVPYDPQAVEQVAGLMRELNLNTVCREASCPNLGECYKKHTATFMILGRHCTRSCRFCNVETAEPQAVDPLEPLRLAQAVEQMGLRHVVITSVTRDDLPDGGAGHFAAAVEAVRRLNPSVSIEVLIPDFLGSAPALDQVIAARPDVFNHNVETVPSLYSRVRPEADYARSLGVLRYAKQQAPRLLVKTGIMVGLGETDSEVLALMDDCLAAGCDILTIGQYLQPSPRHVQQVEYVPLERFEQYRSAGMEKGFRYVASAPLVRSSYRAHEAYLAGGGCP